MPDEIDAPPQYNGRTLLYDSLAQTDIDMDHHRLLHLDDSNLPGGAPPTIGPVAHQWLRSWNSVTRVWGISQPAFTDISGNLTPGQQQVITQLGTITVGVWQGTQIAAGKVPRLDLINLPQANLDLNHHRIINLSNPTDPGDAVSLAYLNATLPGLKIKEAVQCATTNNIALIGNGTTPTIDGHPVVEDQRVLVKNQSNPNQNGIYRARNTLSVHWVRAPDSDTADELDQAYCFVLHGDLWGNTAWVQNNENTDPLGTTPVHYVFFSIGTSGPPGPPGPGVPIDGSAGQILSKIDGADYNTHWIDNAPPGSHLPLGGVEGDVLFKVDSGPYHSTWFSGAAVFALADHGLPDDALIPPGTIDSPGAIGLPTDGMVLARYNAATNGKHCIWVTPLFVNSFNGRNGTVLPAVNDYDFTQIGGHVANLLQGGLPTGGTVGQVLVKTANPPTNYQSSWQTPTPSGAVYSKLQTVQANPTATNSTVGAMMGLGALLTPFVSTKVFVSISGWISSNADTGSAGASICAGTGTAPVNGVPQPGSSLVVGAAALRGPVGANIQIPFSLTAIVYDVTVGVPIWFDILLAAGAPGSARVGAVTVTLFEVP